MGQYKNHWKWIFSTCFFFYLITKKNCNLFCSRKWMKFSIKIYQNILCFSQTLLTVVIRTQSYYYHSAEFVSLSVFYILCKNTSWEIYALLFENNILSGRSKKSLLILQKKKKILNWPSVLRWSCTPVFTLFFVRQIIRAQNQSIREFKV